MRRARAVTTLATSWLLVAAGCATNDDLKRFETDSRELIYQIEQDRARTERDLAVTSLKYQNANDNEKAAIREEIARMEARLGELDKIAADAKSARQGVESLQNQRERQRQAAEDAMQKFDAAQQAFNEYRKHSAY